VATTRDNFVLLRDASARTKIGQTFQVSAANLKLEFVDLLITQDNATFVASSRIWAEIQDNAGNVLATSDKLDASKIGGPSQTLTWTRFVFRTPVSNLATGTTYRIAIAADYALHATVNIIWGSTTAGGYANGQAQQYDGATWTAIASQDFHFKLYLTVNDAAVTMPAGYDQSCKLGYVYNNSAGNFVQFLALDRRVRRLTGSAGANDWLNSTTTIPLLVDLSSLIPPVPVTLHGSGYNTNIGASLVGGGVPDGFGLTAANGDFGQFFINAPGASYATAVPDIYTEFQGAYGYSSAGTGHIYILGWTW
jgi:hypothetical protein